MSARNAIMSTRMQPCLLECNHVYYSEQRLLEESYCVLPFKALTGI